jgi:hypothetical protein
MRAKRPPPPAAGSVKNLNFITHLADAGASGGQLFAVRTPRDGECCPAMKVRRGQQCSGAGVPDFQVTIPGNGGEPFSIGTPG